MSAGFNRDKIAKVLLDTFRSVEGVVSVSIVGSFCVSGDISAISDIDTVVICRELTRELYGECLAAAARLTAEDLGLPRRHIHINPFFGPLKFDTDGQVVVHLMIYDLAGHRDHVLSSPFTCLDWERSGIHVGKSLSELYPVLRLQPRDFVQARRGIEDYLKDLDDGAISYRRYEFHEDTVESVVERHRLDERHRGEYAFHIIKYLVTNYLKLVRRGNTVPADDELVEEWARRLPECSGHIPFFQRLTLAKRHKKCVFPENVVEQARAFVSDFSEAFEANWLQCPRCLFVRHARTPLNDGSFLGQGRDPGILNRADVKPLEQKVDMVFSSPSKRAVETARLLAPNAKIVEDDRLLEINCGKAEGLTLKELRNRFPEMIAAWEAGDDPRFPDGENTSDVMKRLRSFLTSEALFRQNSLVVTHNVVLRCLAGELYGIPTATWYKQLIPHLAVLETVCKGGIHYANFDRSTKARLIDGLVGFKGAR